MKLKRGVSSSSINRLVYGYGARWADDDFQKCSISDRGTGERGRGGARGQVNISREGSKERRDLEGWLPRN